MKTNKTIKLLKWMIDFLDTLEEFENPIFKRHRAINARLHNWKKKNILVFLPIN